MDRQQFFSVLLFLSLSRAHITFSRRALVVSISHSLSLFHVTKKRQVRVSSSRIKQGGAIQSTVQGGGGNAMTVARKNVLHGYYEVAMSRLQPIITMLQ